MVEELLELYKKLYEKSIHINKKLSSKYKIEENKHPPVDFNRIHNAIYLNYEILFLYNRDIKSLNEAEKQRRIKIVGSAENYKKQYSEKINEIQKLVFILTLSHIEFGSSNLKKYVPNYFSTNNKFYFSSFLDYLTKKKLLKKRKRQQWDGIIFFRNKIVHNNAIADVNKQRSYPNFKFLFKKNKMIRDNYKIYPNVIDWTLDSYEELLIDIIDNKNINL